MPLDGDRKPWPFLKTTFNERWGQFSPDGRWVAYVSNESGRDEISGRGEDNQGGHAHHASPELDAADDEVT